LSVFLVFPANRFAKASTTTAKTLFVKNDIVHRQQKSKRTGIRLKTQFRIPNSVIQETKIKYLLLSKQFSHLHAFSEFLDFKRLHGDNENVCNYLTKVNFRKERQMLLTIIGIGANLCIAGNK